MIVYIPINSNDYNNVFTTLSISPRAFYTQRGYSFRRSTHCKLNPFEEYLIAFENVLFHHMDYDNEDGYPILIKTEINNSDLNELEITNPSISKQKTFVISKTIFLFDDFTVLFRNKKEQDEVEARTLKSIETKYSQLAKSNSVVALKNSFYIQNSITSEDIINPDVKVYECFKCERIYNKIAGSIIGYTLGVKSELNPEIIKLKNLSRNLNNTASLLINTVGQSDFGIYKKRVSECLDSIEDEFNKNENLETALILSSNNDINSGLISKLKTGKINNFTIFDLILEGLLSLESDKNLPIQLYIEKCRRDIKQKFNSKYPDNYIRKISISIEKLKFRIAETLNENLNQNNTDFSKILKYNNGNFILPFTISKEDEKYLNKILEFFITQDEINNQDDFFRNRKIIIAKLGQELKEEYPEFINGHRQRDYLINLYNSFDSLTSKFNIAGSDSILFKSLAVLFTSGRDLNKYLKEIEALEFGSAAMPLALWGALYGFASLPKTTTDILLGNIPECKILLKNLKVAQENVMEQTKSSYKPFVYEKEVAKKHNLNSINTETGCNSKKEKTEDDFIKTLNNTKYATNNNLIMLLKTILFNQSNNALINLKKDKIGDFTNQLKRRDNKVKGIGAKSIIDLISRFENYINNM